MGLQGCLWGSRFIQSPEPWRGHAPCCIQVSPSSGGSGVARPVASSAPSVQIHSTNSAEEAVAFSNECQGGSECLQETPIFRDSLAQFAEEREKGLQWPKCESGAYSAGKPEVQNTKSQVPAFSLFATLPANVTPRFILLQNIP